MFLWKTGPLYDRAGEGEGGGGGTAVDPGASYEHDLDEVTPPARVEDPRDARIKALENDLKTERQQKDELSRSERHWADIAQRNLDRDDEEVPEAAAAVAAAPITTEKPEDLLDDVSRDGLAALKRRGVVTRDELDTLLAQSQQRAETRLQEVRTDAGFDAQIAKEFPEIAEASAQISRKERPNSPLFLRAAEIFRQALADDPRLKGSKSTLLLAARAAKAQLEAEDARKGKPAKVTDRDDDDEVETSRQRRRRDRVAVQSTERAPASGNENDDRPTVSKQAREVLAHLKVSEAEFVNNSKRERGR